MQDRFEIVLGNVEQSYYQSLVFFYLYLECKTFRIQVSSAEIMQVYLYYGFIFFSRLYKRMEHQISAVRAKRRNDLVDLKKAVERFLIKTIQRVSKNKSKYQKQMLKAEKRDRHGIKIWDNEFIRRPAILNKFEGPDIAQCIYEIVQEHRVNESLSMLFDYKVQVEVQWFPSLWPMRTAPKHTYISIDAVWDLEELAIRDQQREEYFNMAERGFASIDATSIDETTVQSTSVDLASIDETNTIVDSGDSSSESVYFDNKKSFESIADSMLIQIDQ